MDNYEVLGVDVKSSLEEIKLAYENKVKDIDMQVTNEKNAEAFKKVLKDAYDGIISNKSVLNENGQALGSNIIMSKDESDELLDSIENESEEDYYNNSYDYEYEERTAKKKTKKKRRSSSSSSSKKRSKNKDDDNDEKNKKIKNDKVKEHKRSENKHHHKEESNGISRLLLLPLKILSVPIIIVLSVIILILDLVSVAVWIVSKVLFVASIAVASVYGYQVYIGSAPMRYDLFAVCGGAFVLAVLLPLITKIFRSPLKGINNSLKDFVF